MENISRRAFLSCAAGALVAPRTWAAWPKTAEVPTLLDHVLLGSSDLERGVHPGRGTQNALLSLGERRYLEIIAPDPKQSSVEQYSIIAKLKEPRLIGWAAHRDDLEKFAGQLRREGIEFEGPQAGSRERPDGKVLHWKALRLKDDHGGLLPFFIEWSQDSIHPSVDAPKGCTLTRFEATTPNAQDLLSALSRVQVDLQVRTLDHPSLRASISSPKGEFSLSG